MANQKNNRIEFLDGLRGVAIVLVVIYHAYACEGYAETFPFGMKFAVMPIAVFWVGVQLFFMISGFVILMSLEKCGSLKEFALKRWLRLFPAMLVVSGIILCFDIGTGLGPNPDRSAINLVPGLLFVSPNLIHSATRLTVASLDDPFWSLYVEVVFYALFGTAYFALGGRRAITVIFSLAVGSHILVSLSHFNWGGHILARVASATDWLGLTYFGWFASGALLYEYWRKQTKRDLLLAILAGVAAALTYGLFRFGTYPRIALLIVVAVVIASVVSTRLQGALSNRVFLLIGFLSYPLYLIHDNITVGLTNWIGTNFPTLPDLAMPIVPLIGVTFVAWLIAKFAEPNMRGLAFSFMGTTEAAVATADGVVH